MEPAVWRGPGTGEYAVRGAVLVLVAAGMILGSAPAADAKGGWGQILGPREGIVAPGEDMHIRGEVLFPTLEAAAAARDGSARYYAYLLLRYDRRAVDRAMDHPHRSGWWRAPDRAFPLGRLRFEGSEANFALASGRFEVPEVPADRYAVMLCDLGCERPLPRVVPSTIIVADSPLVARTARRLERTRMRLAIASDRLSQRIRALRGSVERFPAASDYELVTVHQRISELEARIEGAAPRSRGSFMGGRWMAAPVAGALLAGVLLIAARRLRPRRVTAGPGPT